MFGVDIRRATWHARDRLAIDNFVSKRPFHRPSYVKTDAKTCKLHCYCCAPSNRDSLRQHTRQGKKVQRVRSRRHATLRGLTASPATSSKEPLQDYCTTCIHNPTHPPIPFAHASETFQAGSRLQPHLTRWSNRRVKHHIYTLSHREMVVFSSQLSGRM